MYSDTLAVERPERIRQSSISSAMSGLEVHTGQLLMAQLTAGRQESKNAVSMFGHGDYTFEAKDDGFADQPGTAPKDRDAMIESLCLIKDLYL